MMLRTFRSRPMVPAPPSFDGELQDLYASVIEPNLPVPEEVYHQHRRLLDYCRQPEPVFIVRNVTGLQRGMIYTTTSGDHLKASDNAPAWWMHFTTFNSIRDADFAEMPTHMFQVGRILPTQINAAGFHVAHILNAKNRSVDWQNWSREELIRRFIKNLHPCNTFYLPTTEWARYGGNPGVIAFFADLYADRYREVWREFLDVAHGVQPPRAAVPRYVYQVSIAAPLMQKESAAVMPSQSTAPASYRFSRFCFKADVVEPLNMGDTFEMITPAGVFRMTKAEFYRDFDNVVASRSYQEGRIYHYSRPPRKALRYRVPVE